MHYRVMFRLHIAKCCSETVAIFELLQKSEEIVERHAEVNPCTTTQRNNLREEITRNYLFTKMFFLCQKNIALMNYVIKRKETLEKKGNGIIS